MEALSPGVRGRATVIPGQFGDEGTGMTSLQSSPNILPSFEDEPQLVGAASTHLGQGIPPVIAAATHSMVSSTGHRPNYFIRP